MNRPELSRALGLVFAAALAAVPALHAAEDQAIGPGPAPGLEIFDDAAPVRNDMRDTWDAWAAGGAGQPDPNQDGESASGRAARDAARDNFMADPGVAPRSSQPPYRAPDLRRPIARPRPEDRPGAADPAGQGGAIGPYDDPFSNLDEGMPPVQPQQMTERYDPAWDGGMDGGEMYEEPYTPPGQLTSVMDRINIANPYFPGMAQAAGAEDLQGVGYIVLQTLRQRRVVDATMAHGVRGSLGASSPYDFQRLMEAVAQNPQGPEDPMAAALRVNTILDALQQPMIDDPAFVDVMPQLLLRLDNDIYALRYSMFLYQDGDEGVYLELARTYFRAATTCDWFIFRRSSLASDVKAVMGKADTMFYPDGSSRGGDVGGITGNLFQILIMMDHYSRNDSWFRRDLGSMWRTLEKPGRFLLDVAAPDGILPRFGPRGSRELLPEEMDAIESWVTRVEPRVQRIGLAASNSFPHASNVETYSGVYVSRDLKGPLAQRYLSVRFGPRGDLVDVPSHNDFGTIELMSRGVHYLIDPGGYGGRSASGAAHGSLSLDGKYVLTETYNRPGDAADAIWRTNASIDYVADQAGFEDTKGWQRGILYVKNLPGETRSDYWVVMDHVNMRDDPEPRQAIIRYQLAPGVNAYRDGPGVMLSGAMNGIGLRVFAVDAGARIDAGDGMLGGTTGTGQVYDASGGSLPTSSVTVSRRLTGDSTTTTVLYPADDYNHRPLRIERDSDIIRGRTGVMVIDHGMGRVDVVAWAPPGTELVTPTLNLQLAADLAVFRIRRGKIARVDFVNLERFQAKEPEGGLWSMRVNGPAQSMTIEPDSTGGWQVLSDPANRGSASIFDVNLGPTVTRRKFTIRPGEMRVIYR